jgi:hypothetical protein
MKLWKDWQLVNNKPWYRKWWIWVIVCSILVSIPFIINWAYLKGANHENTAFAASDILLFYGSCLAFLGTVSLGALALYQNYKIYSENKNSQKIQLTDIFINMN